MIFGVQAPKLVNGGTTVLLDNCIMDPKFCIGDVIENTSPLNGDKTFIMKGDYAEFKLEIYLFQIPLLANRITKFNEILAQRKELVDFYPHRDGSAIKNESGSVVKFAITDMVPFYYENEASHDAIMLYLKSTKYIDITKGIVT